VTKRNRISVVAKPKRMTIKAYDWREITQYIDAKYGKTETKSGDVWNFIGRFDFPSNGSYFYLPEEEEVAKARSHIQEYIRLVRKEFMSGGDEMIWVDW